MRLRRPRGQRKLACSKCLEPARNGQRYCKLHHAESMKSIRLKQKENNGSNT